MKEEKEECTGKELKRKWKEGSKYKRREKDYYIICEKLIAKERTLDKNQRRKKRIKENKEGRNEREQRKKKTGDVGIKIKESGKNKNKRK